MYESQTALKPRRLTDWTKLMILRGLMIHEVDGKLVTLENSNEVWEKLRKLFQEEEY